LRLGAETKVYAAGLKVELAITFFKPGDVCAVDRYAPSMVKWILDSGRDSFVALFGNESIAAQNLASWIRRSDSEFSGLCSTLAILDDIAMAILVALPGKLIARRRRADMLALIKAANPTQRAGLKENLQRLVGLTAPVGERDYYIRALTVDSAYRGHGVGKKLLERALIDGRASDCERVRLDVQTDNQAALHLYRRFGFQPIHKGETRELGFAVYSMVLPINL